MTWIGLLALLVIAVVVLVVAAKSAPEGWEDDEGFHYGKRPGPWGN